MWAKRIAGVLVFAGVLIYLFGAPKERVIWEPYSPERVEQAKLAGQPVVIDFYADWCIPCHELEQFTYSSQAVIERLAPFVRLKVDATNPTEDESLEPIERFGIIGVPTVLFLDAFGREVEQTRLNGFVPPEEFLRSVELVERVSKAREFR